MIEQIVLDVLNKKHRYFHSKSGDVHEVVMEKDFESIAKSISSKVKTLNRKEVEKIFKKSNAYNVIDLWYWEMHSNRGLTKRGANNKTTEAVNNVMKPFLDQICNLAVEEGDKNK